MRPRAAPTCEICEKFVSKYKYPSCLVPYCSLGCFKKHKETPCAKPSAPEEKPASPAKEVSVETKDVVVKTEHKASASSSEIREALKDEALQKLISSIGSSSNPLQELDEAMAVEAFRVLTEKNLANISKIMTSNDRSWLVGACKHKF